MKRGKTSNRMLIILAMVFVVAATLLAFQRTQQTEVRPTPVVAYHFVFPEVAATDIQAIRLRNPVTGDSLSMARAADGSWTLPEISGTLNPTDANGIAQTMVLLPFSRTLPLSEAEDLQTYGFTPEGIFAIEFVLSNGTSHAVAVGYRTPTDNSYYGLIDDRGDLYLLERPAIDYLISRLKNPPIT